MSLACIRTFDAVDCRLMPYLFNECGITAFECFTASFCGNGENLITIKIYLERKEFCRKALKKSSGNQIDLIEFFFHATGKFTLIFYQIELAVNHLEHDTLSFSPYPTMLT